MKRKLPHLYVILDADFMSYRRIPDLAKTLSSIGVKMFQVRWKKAPSDKLFFELVKSVMNSTPADCIIIVNDRADIALACGAGGVHVGENDLPPEAIRKIAGDDFLIGYSAHSLKEITDENITAQATYLAFGTIFPTSTKGSGTKVQGTRKLREAVKISPLPLYAVGGINLDNVHEVINTGVHGIACISAVLGAEDPSEATKKLLDAFGETQ